MEITLKKQLETDNLFYKNMVEMLSKDKTKNQQKLEKYQELYQLTEKYLGICNKRGRF